MKQIYVICATLLLLLTGYSVRAEQLNMIRVKAEFPETMLKLQEVIKEHGYTLSRVQRVDIGLTKSGYQTDKYRVAFFAKPDELHWLIDNHPELIPYLPLKIAIYAEGKDTILVIYNPEILFEPASEDLRKIVTRWQADLTSMFREMHKFGQE